MLCLYLTHKFMFCICATEFSNACQCTLFDQIIFMVSQKSIQDAGFVLLFQFNYYVEHPLIFYFVCACLYVSIHVSFSCTHKWCIVYIYSKP